MKGLNVKVLERMADTKLDKAYKKAGMASLPVNIMQALETKLEKKREEAAAEAAEVIIELYDTSDEVICSLVEDIRALRAKVKASKLKLEQIARSKAFGAETGNFLPLAKVLNFNVAIDNMELSKIPKDWTPKDVVEVPVVE